jgi:Thiol-activated cytolysin
MLVKGRWRRSIWALTLAVGAGSSVAACGEDGTVASDSPGGSGGEPDGNAGAPTTPGEGGAGATPSGGSSAGGVGGEESTTGGVGESPVDSYFDALGDWSASPAPSETKSEPTVERRNLQTESGTKWPFDCELVEHDIVEQHEEILNFDSGAEYVKPGVLLVGNEFVKGNLSPIPLPRAPITISINVPGVTTAKVVIQDPNISNIQQGIATLQAEAEAASDSYAAQLSYEQHTVQSTQEMAVKLGVSAGFDGLFASANFSAQFENEETVEKYTVVSKLMQQMYTITFAQDGLRNARSFFSPTLSIDDVLDAEADGFLAKDNVPVFIGSVTYGRMVVFTATSSKAGSRQALQTSLQASGSSWSASADLSAEQRSFLASLDIEVLSIGGNQSEVTQAIKTGDWSELYAGADILNSVPLRYTVHAITGTRPIAAIGDTTSFTTADCSAVEGWYERTGPAGLKFTDISTNPGNSPIALVGETGGTYAPYSVGEDDITLTPGYSKTAALDVAVDDVGNTFIYDAVSASFSRLAPGSQAWSTYPQVNAFGALSFDAGGQDFLVALTQTYSDNQNNLIKINWGSPPIDWIDESQNMKTNEAPWFAAVGTGYVGRHGNELGRRANDGGWTQYSADTTELNTVQKYTAASATELYALRIATGQVVRFNAATKKFDRPINPPTGKTILQAEATSNGRLWAITTDGKLYAYSPPR